MVEDDLDLGGRLLPQHLALEVALVDADHQRHSHVGSEHPLGQGEGESFLFLLLALKGEVHPVCLMGYLSLPF